MQVATTNGARPLTISTRTVSTPKINPGIEGALSLIANSTSLSPSEKHSFIQDLADISKFGGDNPALIMQLIKAIMALIASRPTGQYSQDSLSDVEAEYWDDRGGITTTTTTTTTSIGTNILA